MNEIQKEILAKLQEKSKLLGRSIRKRDDLALAMRCYNHFTSFNEAKLMAGLTIRNVKKISFPKNAFDLDLDAVRIASYITFDGHLYNNLSWFMFSSKRIEDIENFTDIIRKNLVYRLDIT